jgi:hypothetical protein
MPELFSEEELIQLRREFLYQDSVSPPMFTEHELDEECGGGINSSNNEDIVRNFSTKSMVLAPFNSTISEKSLGLVIVNAPLMDRRVIKYANRVKDVNRQYEMNNNCDLDNGVYNKFLNKSSDEGSLCMFDSMLTNSLVSSIKGE